MDEPGFAERLSRLTAPATLFESAPGDAVRCTACAHRCLLAPGRSGICRVRTHTTGGLQAPFGYVARRNVRAVETNTLYHVRPGAPALTFGMYGCDLHCPYCHNWRISQAPRSGGEDEHPIEITPRALVAEALAAGCQLVVSAYNEPLITAEWAAAIFAEARSHGLLTAVVSDGHATPEVLAYLRPVTDVFRVDLKAENEAQYRTLGGRRAPVMAAIREALRLGYWVEVVTLVVPGFNDDMDGLRAIADELAAISPGLPWHLNAFHPRHRWADRARTGPAILVSAAGAAYARGLRHVYVGNLPDVMPGLSHTRCPSCRQVVIERNDYVTQANHLRDGACASCGTSLPGLW